MKKIFVRFPTTGKVYTYSTDNTNKTGLGLTANQQVLVEKEGIIEPGLVVEDIPQLSSKSKNTILEEGDGQILRAITPEDRERLYKNKETARGFIDQAREKIIRHSLNLKILDADLSFDEKKLTFYFCAEGRVDFRSLVTDMVRSFNKLIRLQQVGSRDETKYFGGIGKCGRELCCSKFLNNLESITLDMAEIQELSTAGSSKLSGCCGKLMCCLAFEAQNYKDLKKKMPKIGSDFSSVEGSGKVMGHNLLEGRVILQTKEGKKIEVLV